MEEVPVPRCRLNRCLKRQTHMKASHSLVMTRRATPQKLHDAQASHESDGIKSCTSRFNVAVLGTFLVYPGIALCLSIRGLFYLSLIKHFCILLAEMAHSPLVFVSFSFQSGAPSILFSGEIKWKFLVTINFICSLSINPSLHSFCDFRL